MYYLNEQYRKPEKRKTQALKCSALAELLLKSPKFLKDLGKIKLAEARQ